MRSYRIDQPKPRPKHRSMQDTATPGEVFIHNGCTAHLAIPCWYLETRPPIPAHHHDRQHHDMIGWPTPTRPDHCCQEWDFDRSCCSKNPRLRHCPPHCEHFLDMGRLIPIHLTEEGYTDIEVNFLDSDRNTVSPIRHQVDAEATIDPVDDWVVRIAFSVYMEDKALIPEDDPVVFYYSVYLISAKEPQRRDLVTVGKLIVLPSPIGERA